MSRRKLFILVTVFVLGSSSLIVKASSLGDYVVSDNPKKIEQRRTVGSGSRSNCQSQFPEKSISLLVPSDKVVHQTISSRPPLYIFSEVSSSVPFKFTFVDPQSALPIVEKNLWITSPGIKQIVLPESVSLKERKIYLWYVAVPCQNNPEQYYEILSSAVEKVSLPNSAKQAIARANSSTEIAATYATNGIWYDALKYASKKPDGYLKQLLFSAGITDLGLASNN